MDPDLKDALAYLKDKALCAPPLKLTADFRRTFYIFTDGSLEDSYAGLGGILYDSLGSPLAFFSGTVPEDVLSALRKQSSHPIYEVELLAVWVAMTLWESALSDAYSVCYLDNEAAQGALIACKSSTLAGTAIVRDILDLEDRCRCRPWYGRVPSHSNPSDPPSRGDCAALLGAGLMASSMPVEFPDVGS